MCLRMSSVIRRKQVSNGLTMRIRRKIGEVDSREATFSCFPWQPKSSRCPFLQQAFDGSPQRESRCLTTLGDLEAGPRKFDRRMNGLHLRQTVFDPVSSLLVIPLLSASPPLALTQDSAQSEFRLHRPACSRLSGHCDGCKASTRVTLFLSPAAFAPEREEWGAEGEMAARTKSTACSDVRGRPS